MRLGDVLVDVFWLLQTITLRVLDAGRVAFVIVAMSAGTGLCNDFRT